MQILSSSVAHSAQSTRQTLSPETGLSLLLRVTRRLVTVELYAWSLRSTPLGYLGSDLRAAVWTWARRVLCAVGMSRAFDSLDGVVARRIRSRVELIESGRAQFDASPRGLRWVPREKWLDAQLVDAEPTHCEELPEIALPSREETHAAWVRLGKLGPTDLFDRLNALKTAAGKSDGEAEEGTLAAYEQGGLGYLAWLVERAEGERDADAQLSADPEYSERCDDLRAAAIADQEERAAALAAQDAYVGPVTTLSSDIREVA